MSDDSLTPKQKRTSSAESEQDDAALLTRRELSELLSVHPMTVTKWERDGLPIAQRGRKGKPSYYREVEVRAWLQAREEAAQQVGPVDGAMERALKDRWDRMLKEQTHAVRARKLLPADEVERAWAAEIAGARALILSSYTAAADRVFRAATLDGLGGVERELKAVAFTVLRELAARATEDPAA